MNTSMPFSVHDNVDHPISLYAASKKANELMAHAYSHLFALPTTGLRFFTVYGPWGRPDMALFLFTKAMLEDKPIDVFNNGEMKRDFTYIDDIIEGVLRALDRIAEPNPDWSHMFGRQDEIRHYLERCAEKYDLTPHIRLSTEVAAAEWAIWVSRWAIRRLARS